MQLFPRLLRAAVVLTAALAVFAAAEAFLWPGLLVVRDLGDPGLKGPGISERALDLHRSLAERIEPWARERIESQVAATVPLHHVPQTEWPIFTAVFFLNATEALADEGVDVAYAMPSVEAARDLIMDPSHHTWVVTHWGDDYLHDENVFFRSLLIAGLTSYEALTHSGRDLDFLRDQVDTLARDLDRSPHGVLQDYPGETYPIDVLAAIAYIHRADEVLGTDHSAFVARARRAFVAPYDDELGLVRFRVDLLGDAPEPVQPGRGIGNSWVGIYAPELWPEDASRWYETHEAEFWQERWWATGFREFRRGGLEGEWTFEVDAGPVLDGFGTSASAFGIAAARRNGRFDHAYTLSAQMVSSSWPWADGSLLLPRFFSDPHAPMLGEAALAYFLTVQPAEDVPVVEGGGLTVLVFFGLFVYFGTFFITLWMSIRTLRSAFRERAWPQPKFALITWACGFGLALIASFADVFVALGLLVVTLAHLRRQAASA
ncbi:MAG: hypothetical protein AAGE52_23075 [Myxococcota bacterium]